jgi:hypothetical protein
MPDRLVRLPETGKPKLLDQVRDTIRRKAKTPNVEWRTDQRCLDFARHDNVDLGETGYPKRPVM